MLRYRFPNCLTEASFTVTAPNEYNLPRSAS